MPGRYPLSLILSGFWVTLVDSFRVLSLPVRPDDAEKLDSFHKDSIS
jgi:hypothetical protein